MPQGNTSVSSYGYPTNVLLMKVLLINGKSFNDVRKPLTMPCHSTIVRKDTCQRGGKFKKDLLNFKPGLYYWPERKKITCSRYPQRYACKLQDQSTYAVTYILFWQKNSDRQTDRQKHHAPKNPLRSNWNPWATPLQKPGVWRTRCIEIAYCCLSCSWLFCILGATLANFENCQGTT